MSEVVFRRFAKPRQAIAAIAPYFNHLYQQLEMSAQGRELVDSLVTYSGIAYRKVKAALSDSVRDDLALDNDLLDLIERLTRVIDKCATQDNYFLYSCADFEDLSLYLGCEPQVFERNSIAELPLVMSPYLDKTFRVKRFFSTSACSRSAFIKKPIMFLLKVPQGSKAAWLGYENTRTEKSRFEYPWQNELLLQRESEFCITHISTGYSGKLVIHCDLVDQPSPSKIDRCNHQQAKL